MNILHNRNFTHFFLTLHYIKLNKSGIFRKFYFLFFFIFSHNIVFKKFDKFHLKNNEAQKHIFFIVLNKFRSHESKLHISLNFL